MKRFLLYSKRSLNLLRTTINFSDTSSGLSADWMQSTFENREKRGQNIGERIIMMHGCVLSVEILVLLL